MKHLFVSYDIAVSLKAAGFDQDCFAGYKKDKYLCYPSAVDRNQTYGDRVYGPSKPQNRHIVKAPLYQQVIDWFESEHGMLIQVVMDITGSFTYSIGSLHPSSTYKGMWIHSSCAYNRKEAWIEVIKEAITLL